MIDLLKTFCHPEKENLEKPFSQNGNTYATDGRILVVAPGLILAEHRDYPDMSQLFKGIDANFCKKCDQANVSMPDLSIIGENPNLIQLDARVVDGRLLKKIDNLPGVKLASEWRDSLEVVHFKWDCGHGLLMPIMCDFPEGEPLLKREVAA